MVSSDAVKNRTSSCYSDFRKIPRKNKQLEFPQNVISKRIYCSEVPICRFFESLRMAVLKIEALE